MRVDYSYSKLIGDGNKLTITTSALDPVNGCYKVHVWEKEQLNDGCYRVLPKRPKY